MSTQPNAQTTAGPAGGANDEERATTRDRIKAAALDLLIQYGYRGMSFGDLARALDTTRANIHYHFGHKQTLVEEVLIAYARDTIAGTAAIFDDPDATFVEKIENIVAHSRRKYEAYNRPGDGGHPWSLIARMRQDSTFLTPKGNDALHAFGQELHETILRAVVTARQTGEFDPGTPVEDVALQLFGIANSASPITQDAGSFERLEQLYLGFARIVVHAFGRKGAA